METGEIEALLARAVTGELTAREARRLKEACEGDRELRHRFIRLIQVDRLAGLAMANDEASFVREFRLRVASEGEAGGEFSSGVILRLRRARLKRLALGVAATAAAVLISLFVIFGMEKKPVVEVRWVDSLDWNPSAKEFKIGERIMFESGLAEIEYFTGVRIVIEGPVDFEITGENRGYLHEGKFVVEVCDETAHGFTIDGASGRLIDFGTRFAVEVKPSGEMEVHVIEGEVDAIATGGKASRLYRDQAMRLAGGGVQSMKADAGKFVTKLPEYRERSPGIIRWSFDAIRDQVAPDMGGTLAKVNAEARLLSFSGKGEGPQPVEAPFGKGLRFDGVDSFLESGYRGISGGEPRTVAFWVRVPEDFDRFQGYGIISWGDVTVPGGAWQVSVNGTEEEGPVGHLRIGTNLGQVIGTTDLRDGQWHHCAVVMYGDEKRSPNTFTHILLYVDGILEPAARKSMQSVNTEKIPGGARSPHGIWIGRNLAFEYEGSLAGNVYGSFFRGDLDEMVICDAALNQKQIIRLMKENVIGPLVN